MAMRKTKKATKGTTTRTTKRKGTKRKGMKRRGSSRTMQSGITDLVKGLAGAYVAAQVMDAPFVANVIKEPKMRYLLGAAGSVFVAVKFPKLAPFALGAGVGCGYRAAVAYFPQLAQPLIQGPRRIGRMDQGQINKLRWMVEKSRQLHALNGGNRGVLMGNPTLMGPQRSERGTRWGVIMGASFN